MLEKNMNLQTNPLNVAVGILINGQNEILLTRRQSHQLYSDYWEFPGGKIESGETPDEGLKRELLEEIGVQSKSMQPIISVKHTYPEYSVVLNVYWVKTYDGTPSGVEGQALKWCPKKELASLTLLPANEIILQALSDLAII